MFGLRRGHVGVAVTPIEVKAFAEAVVLKLQIERANGRVTPDHPMTGPEIVKAYNARFELSWRDKDFCAVIHYARETLKAPIGSNTGGYYFCLTEQEYDEFYGRENARIANQRRAIIAPKIAMRKRAQQTLLPTEDAPPKSTVEEQISANSLGTIAALKREFGAVEVR